MQPTSGSAFVFHRAQGPGGDVIAVCRGCRQAATLERRHLPSFAAEHAHPELDPRSPDGGLGDAVAALTRALGIQPCGGCKQRQATLNAIFPFRRRP